MSTRAGIPAGVAITPLTPELRDQLVSFLGEEAFTDNPEWSSCYCQFPLEDHESIDWDAQTAERNRAMACSRIDARIMRGHVAMQNGRIVGWCAAGPRDVYPMVSEGARVDEPGTVGSIMCFVVAPDARGHGIGTALLDAVIAGFRAEGLAVAEAYPRREASRPAAKYHGTLNMYRSAGFAVVEDRPDGVVVVRRNLA
jgi:ribosomal protein S18 acetylase RimI-like enzyme